MVEFIKKEAYAINFDPKAVLLEKSFLYDVHVNARVINK